MMTKADFGKRLSSRLHYVHDVGILSEWAYALFTDYRCEMEPEVRTLLLNLAYMSDKAADSYTPSALQQLALELQSA